MVGFKSASLCELVLHSRTVQRRWVELEVTPMLGG